MRNSKVIALMSAMLISFASFSICAAPGGVLDAEIAEAIQNDNLYIENSYFIGFKNPSELDAENSQNQLIEPFDESRHSLKSVPVGEHSTGQSKENLAGIMGLRGEVLSIYESMNAVHVKMDADEAERWRQDERVEYVEQDVLITMFGSQMSPGWALDRMDEISPVTLDSSYNYTKTGAGRTIYVLDSGLDLSKPKVAAEFGGRAQIIWDMNHNSGTVPPDWGKDCHGHGTSVASLIAGNTKGIAKGASLKIAKITVGCGYTMADTSGTLNAIITVLNWMVAEVIKPGGMVKKGAIVNLSNGIQPKNVPCGSVHKKFALDNAVRAAHNKGIIVVVAAGNDGCNTTNYSPTHISEAFVVGGTRKDRILSHGQDEKHLLSRTGTNISTFAPGWNVSTLDNSGNPIITVGTSLSTAIMSGVFATYCQANISLCTTSATATPIYSGLKSNGVMNTVVNPGGGTLIGADSRFIPQRW